MKCNPLYKLLLIVVASIVLVACDQGKDHNGQLNGPVELNSPESRISYGMGVSLGLRAQQDDIDVDALAFAAGMNDVLEGNELQMTQEEIAEEMQSYQQQRIAEQQAAFEALAVENLVVGQAFLEENSQQEGVVTLDSGLQYKILDEGDGAIPTADDVVEVHYVGTLLDGTVFDSSYQRGETVTFPVEGVIPGWVEALQLMPVGSKWQLFIPPELAYGQSGAPGGPIGPNATLLFEVELIDIEDDNGASEQ